MKYERITKKDDRGYFVPYEENSIIVQSRGAYGKIIDRLAEFENKIENGTLVEIPCKPGDTVYYIRNGTIYEDTLFSFEFEVSTVPLAYFYDYFCNHNKNQRKFVLTSNYKITWFTNKEEAEAKVKENKERKYKI